MVKGKFHIPNVFHGKPFGPGNACPVDIDKRNIGAADDSHPGVALPRKMRMNGTSRAAEEGEKEFLSRYHPEKYASISITVDAKYRRS